MSANRKLQTEVQQVLKKVEEGVLLFDDIWSKVYAAGVQSLKEKYEGDLKKEIKKLQRLRDQIKTWLGSSEIKDKQPLTEARQLIERKMEQFKICEKDTKTKAYSNGGLERRDRSDPKDAEREEKREWLNTCLERLSDLISGIDSDIEKVSAGRGKAKNKEQIDKLENRKRKAKWHIARLEQIIRLLESEDLDPSKVDTIKEDVEYYIDSAAEDDGQLGVDDEFDIYEELQLDSLSAQADLNESESAEKEAAAAAAAGGEGEGAEVAQAKPPVASPLVTVGVAKKAPTPTVVATIGKAQIPPRGSSAPAAAPSSAPAPAPTPLNAAKGPVKAPTGSPAPTSKAQQPQSQPGPSNPSASVPPIASMPPVAPKPNAQPQGSNAKAAGSDSKKVSPAGAGAAAGTTTGSAKAPSVESSTSNTKKQEDADDSGASVAPPSAWTQPSQRGVTPSPPPTLVDPGMGTGTGTGTSLQPQPPQAQSAHHQPSDSKPPAPAPNQASNLSPSQQGTNGNSPQLTSQNLGPGSNTPQLGSMAPPLQPNAVRPAQPPAQGPQGNLPVGAGGPSTFQQRPTTPNLTGLPTPSGTSASFPLPPGASPQLGGQPVPTQAQGQSRPGPGAGATGVGPAGQPSYDSMVAMNMLKSSMFHSPDTIDVDKQATYAPRNPYAHTHPSYPTQPLSMVESGALFERLPMDALFFAFYYQPGTFQQYLAAKQLKKHSWRFHKKYMTWFQRHEEPKIASDDFEEGTYVYFDYESGWCQRIKSEFKFEYAYLEDELPSTSNPNP